MTSETALSNVESDDFADVRVLAVTVGDVVAALEANERRDAGAVLRVTPPFSGRMRARLHLDGAESRYDDPSPIHVPPEQFVETIPPFPDPDETEDDLRADPDVAYSPERHRTYHESVVENWREQVREALVERVTIETLAGQHAVRITPLG